MLYVCNGALTRVVRPLGTIVERLHAGVAKDLSTRKTQTNYLEASKNGPTFIW